MSVHPSFLREFRALNVERAFANFGKNPPVEKNITYFAMALAGEVGELCNAIKKRIRALLPGDVSAGDVKNIASEIADVATYLDLLASIYEIDLEDAMREKFAEVSDRVGFKKELLSDEEMD